MITLYIYCAACFIACIGIVLDQELAWYHALLLLILSPVFVPFFIGIKISKI